MNRSTTKAGLLICFLLITALSSFAQSKFTASAAQIKINGTSTLHDWEMTTAKSNIVASFTTNEAGALTDLEQLSFSITAESLKSGKAAMDKNAYKALKTGSNRDISYTATTASISPAGANTYQVKCTGKMTIAGTTRETDLVATCKLNPDKTLAVTGIKKIKMTDYNVEPPSFMFGTVTTGNDIAINFNVTLKK